MNVSAFELSFAKPFANLCAAAIPMLGNRWGRDIT